jgi:hypothetical protein
MSKGTNEEEYWQACTTIISRLDSGGHFLFPSIIFSSSMKESSILFNLSTSSKTGWKYSWSLNKEGIDGGCGGGVLAIDSLVCCSPIAAVFVVAAVAACPLYIAACCMAGAEYNFGYR